MEKKKFEIGSPLYKDENKIIKTKCDLGLFVEMLNKQIGENVKSGILDESEITLDLVKELALFKTDSLLAIIKSKYEAEANNIKLKPARDRFLEGLKNVMNDIVAQYRSAEEYVKSNIKPGSFYFRSPNERLSFLLISNGKVEYNYVNVQDAYTIRIASEKQADILNRANKLYEELVEFNKELYQCTNNGISVITGTKCGLIAFDNGVLVFKPETIAEYNF